MAVVFSDIVGSTALRNRLGELDFTPLREAHDAVAGDLVGACGGQVVRWQGDGLVAAFSSAGQALEYASKLQPSVDQLEGRVGFDLRVGIGLGDVLNETTGQLDGPAFVDAARLCDAAQPRSGAVHRPGQPRVTLVRRGGFRAARRHDVEGPGRSRGTRVPAPRARWDFRRA